MPFPYDQDHQASRVFISLKGYIVIKQLDDPGEGESVMFAPAQIPDLIERLKAAHDLALAMHEAGEFDEETEEETDEETEEEDVLNAPLGEIEPHDA